MKKLFNSLFSLSLLLIIVWGSIPKNYFHRFASHHHAFHLSEHQHQHGKTEVSTGNNCQFEKFDSAIQFFFVENTHLLCELLNYPELAIADFTFSHARTSATQADLRAPPLG